MSELKIGMIGLDTSHVPAFTKMLNDKQHPHHVPGGNVQIAFPGGSDKMSQSYERVEGFTAQMRDELGVEIVDTIEEVAERCDAILLESVDGRQHLEQFEKIAPFGKPVYIDKPLTTSSAEAKRIFELSDQHNSPVFSSSSLRYAVGIADLAENASVLGCQAHGPNAKLPGFPPLYWYGIHAAEILYTLMGSGCVEVHMQSSDIADVAVGVWDDGRIGVLNGYRIEKVGKMGATIFTDKGIRYGEAQSKPPAYSLMLQEVIGFFQTGKSPVERHEMLEIIRFLEAANESLEAGKAVKL